MVVFNPAKREIGGKIVYYGPALCGKTTNLQFIHNKLNPQQRGELVNLATRDDRTLFFDFLPLDLGTVKGFKTRFHLYTVPGQVYYVSTRRAVLTGVDGIVFVADSQNDKMAENIESLEDLEKNLRFYGKKLQDIPMVMQYNKCDLNNLAPIEELNKKINKFHLPYLQASAATGQGVMETLTMVCKVVLSNLENRSKKNKVGAHRKAGAAAVGASPDTSPPSPSRPVSSSPAPFKPPQSTNAEESHNRGREIDKLQERKGTVDNNFAKSEEIEDLDSVDQGDSVLEKPQASPPTVNPYANRQAEKVKEEKQANVEKIQYLGPEMTESGIEIPEEPPEFEEFEEGIQLEPCEEPLEFEPPENKFQPEGVKKPEQPAISLTPEGFNKKPQEAVKKGGLEIVACGQPKSIAPASVKLPLTLKHPSLQKELIVNVTINIQDYFSE